MHNQITYLASKRHKDATIVLHDRIQIKIFIGNEYVGSGITLPDTCKVKLFQHGTYLCQHVFVLFVGVLRPTREFFTYMEMSSLLYIFTHTRHSAMRVL